MINLFNETGFHEFILMPNVNCTDPNNIHLEPFHFESPKKDNIFYCNILLNGKIETLLIAKSTLELINKTELGVWLDNDRMFIDTVNRLPNDGIYYKDDDGNTYASKSEADDDKLYDRKIIKQTATHKIEPFLFSDVNAPYKLGVNIEDVEYYPGKKIKKFTYYILESVPVIKTYTKQELMELYKDVLPLSTREL